jgi:hypothetical protein
MWKTISLLVVLTGTAHGQTIDLTGRGQVLTLRRPQSQPLPPPSRPVVDSRPVMTMFVTDSCGWCDIGKWELYQQSDSLPVQVKIVHTSSGKVPSWVTGYPTFYWQAIDQTWKKRDGWPGVEPLIASWRMTQQIPSPQQAASGYRGNTRSQWTFPGSTRNDLIRHLQDGQHRGKFTLSQLNRMTFGQLKQLHSDDHSGQIAWGQLPACPPGRK